MVSNNPQISEVLNKDLFLTHIIFQYWIGWEQSLSRISLAASAVQIPSLKLVPVTHVIDSSKSFGHAQVCQNSKALIIPQGRKMDHCEQSTTISFIYFSLLCHHFLTNLLGAMCRLTALTLCLILSNLVSCLLTLLMINNDKFCHAEILIFFFFFLLYHALQYSCLENPMDGGAW